MRCSEKRSSGDESSTSGEHASAALGSGNITQETQRKFKSHLMMYCFPQCLQNGALSQAPQWHYSDITVIYWCCSFPIHPTNSLFTSDTTLVQNTISPKLLLVTGMSLLRSPLRTQAQKFRQLPSLEVRAKQSWGHFRKISGISFHKNETWMLPWCEPHLQNPLSCCPQRRCPNSNFPLVQGQQSLGQHHEQIYVHILCAFQRLSTGN